MGADVEKSAKPKDPSFVSCTDMEGKKITRCPCYVNGGKCNEIFKCYNCGNTVGARNTDRRQDNVQTPERKNMINGRWTQLETCILYMTENQCVTKTGKHSPVIPICSTKQRSRIVTNKSICQVTCK